MSKVAVVISGCGHLDGAEIFETVFTLLELDKNNAKVEIFAPNLEQRQVMNHLTQEKMYEKRNVLVESARIARGQIQALPELEVQNFDALILPGGFGAALNLSDLAVNNENAKIIADLQEIILQFYKAAKPIGAICISPALLALSLKEHANITITLGDKNDLIQKLSATEQTCLADNIVVDEKNKLVTTPAFMINAPLIQIHTGISTLVAEVMEMCIKT